MPIVFRAALVTTLASFLAYPLHPQAWQRPAGSIDYRITNPFGGVDLVNTDQAHQGVDLGNTRQGDAIRAPATCKAKPRRHFDGSLGYELDLGGGVTLELWHLSRLVVGVIDQWIDVAAGRIIGYTGASGPVAGAHTHVEIKQDGVPFDPQPFLPMAEREPIPIPGSTAPGQTYIDVPPTSPYYSAVEWMVDMGLGGAATGGEWRPDRAMSRGQFAIFLQRFYEKISDA